MRLDKALLAYTIDLQAERKSPTTIRWYRHKLQHFASWLAQEEGVSDVEGLTADRIRAFLRWLQALKATVDGSRELKKGTPSSLTIHGYAQVVKTFCGWLTRNGHLTDNPCQNMTMPKVEQYVIQAFTADDVRRMLKADQ